MSWNHFDLNLLRALDALLSERNVTRAAERLFITQPAMSGALQRLRDYFKDQLLVRTGRDMELTPLARALAEPVHELLLRAQITLATRPSFDPKLARRKFRIAMSDYVAMVLMPAVLRRLAIEAPYINCQLDNLNEHSFSQMEAGDLDFYITSDNWSLNSSYEPSHETRFEKLFNDDFVCVTHAENHFERDQISLDEYRSMPHVVIRFGHRAFSLIDHSWKMAGLEMNVQLTVPNFWLMLFLLPGTRLIATVQRRLIKVINPKDNLKMVECPVPFSDLQEVLAWHTRNEFDPGHLFLRRLVIEEAANI